MENTERVPRELKDDHGFYIWPSNIVLPGLDIRHQVPKYVHYKHLGEVESLKNSFAREKATIKGHIIENRSLMDKILGGLMNRLVINEEMAFLESRWPSIDSDCGGCYEVNIEGIRNAYVLAIKKALSPEKKVFTEGHESGEYLQKIGQMNAIQGELDDRDIRLQADSKDFAGERFADICGLLAIKKAMEKGRAISVPRFKNPRPWLPALTDHFNF